MTIQIVSVTNADAPSGVFNLSAAHDEKFLAVDASLGDLVFALPAAASLPAGWHVPTVMKIDNTSNTVQFRPTQAGDKLNWFWDTNAPYGPYLNLTQQAAELVCDGVSRFHLMGKTFHRDQPQSQRTIITPSYNVLPKDVREILRCNTAVCGGSVGLYFNPVSQFTHGGYMSNVIEVQKVDDAPYTVTIFPYAGDALNGVTNASFTLTSKLETVKLYIASDGLWVHRHYKP